MRTKSGLIAVFGALAFLFGISPVSAQTAPPLGTAQSFAVLGGSTVTNTGSSVITGDLGVSPGSAATGFPPGVVVSGTIHRADATAAAAESDLTNAYNNISGQACTQDLTGQDLGGKILTAGVYCFSASAQLTGTLTLNAQGNAGAVFIFKIGSTLTTASGSSVVISNGGSACNVFWQVGSSATLGTTSSFSGNILALTSITLTTGASVTGRALARNGAVTLDSDSVTVAACSSGPAPAPAPGGPTPPVANCAATSPDLFITKHHAGAFAVGVNGTYGIALFNQGVAATSGTITVTDTLPAGLTFVSGTGVTWTCGAVGQIVTCTTPGPATAASPYPNNITLTVMPGAASAPGVTNAAAVTGGNDCDLTNNATTDVTVIGVSVPTLPEWAFIALAMLLAGGGVVALRRRAAV